MIIAISVRYEPWDHIPLIMGGGTDDHVQSKLAPHMVYSYAYGM